MTQRRRHPDNERLQPREEMFSAVAAEPRGVGWGEGAGPPGVRLSLPGTKQTAPLFFRLWSGISVTSASGRWRHSDFDRPS